jgi:hypothetical protein
MAPSSPSSSSSRPIGWARCLDNVADVLRRGAWYPILEETTDGKVVIEVRQRPVRVSRIDVGCCNVGHKSRVFGDRDRSIRAAAV